MRGVTRREGGLASRDAIDTLLELVMLPAELSMLVWLVTEARRAEDGNPIPAVPAVDAVDCMLADRSSDDELARELIDGTTSLALLAAVAMRAPPIDTAGDVPVLSIGVSTSVKSLEVDSVDARCVRVGELDSLPRVRRMAPSRIGMRRSSVGDGMENSGSLHTPLRIVTRQMPCRNDCTQFSASCSK